MLNFRDAFPAAFGVMHKPTCICCDGRRVIPKDGKVVTCDKCRGTGVESLSADEVNNANN